MYLSTIFGTSLCWKGVRSQYGIVSIGDGNHGIWVLCRSLMEAWTGFTSLKHRTSFLRSIPERSPSWHSASWQWWNKESFSLVVWAGIPCNVWSRYLLSLLHQVTNTKSSASLPIISPRKIGYTQQDSFPSILNDLNLVFLDCTGSLSIKIFLDFGSNTVTHDMQINQGTVTLVSASLSCYALYCEHILCIEMALYWCNKPLRYCFQDCQSLSHDCPDHSILLPYPEESYGFKVGTTAGS